MVSEINVSIFSSLQCRISGAYVLAVIHNLVVSNNPHSQLILNPNFSPSLPFPHQSVNDDRPGTETKKGLKDSRESDPCTLPEPTVTQTVMVQGVIKDQHEIREAYSVH